VQRNVTRVCMHTVSDECVRAYGEDYCIAQLLAQLLKPTIEVVEVEQPPNLVPIVVPTVLGGWWVVGGDQVWWEVGGVVGGDWVWCWWVWAAGCRAGGWGVLSLRVGGANGARWVGGGGPCW
jgi:hypothetical protein